VIKSDMNNLKGQCEDNADIKKVFKLGKPTT